MLSKKFALIIIFLFAFARFLTIADMRSYVWTYEYLLIDPGKAEIEHYMTISTPKINIFLAMPLSNTKLNSRLE